MVLTSSPSTASSPSPLPPTSTPPMSSPSPPPALSTASHLSTCQLECSPVKYAPTAIADWLPMEMTVFPHALPEHYRLLTRMVVLPVGPALASSDSFSLEENVCLEPPLPALSLPAPWSQLRSPLDPPPPAQDSPANPPVNPPVNPPARLILTAGQAPPVNLPPPAQLPQSLLPLTLLLQLPLPLLLQLPLLMLPLPLILSLPLPLLQPLPAPALPAHQPPLPPTLPLFPLLPSFSPPFALSVPPSLEANALAMLDMSTKTEGAVCPQSHPQL